MKQFCGHGHTCRNHPKDVDIAYCLYQEVMILHRVYKYALYYQVKRNLEKLKDLGESNITESSEANIPSKFNLYLTGSLEYYGDHLKKYHFPSLHKLFL